MLRLPESGSPALARGPQWGPSYFQRVPETERLVTGNRIEKRFPRAALICSDAELLARIDRLLQLGTMLPAPLSYGVGEFAWEGDTLVQRIRVIPNIATTALLASGGICDVADTLKAAHSLGLAHGDVHLKNLRASAGRCVIVDWEPCLRQYRCGRPTLLYTRPHIAPEDAVAGKLSIKTDQQLLRRLANLSDPNKRSHAS